MKKNIYLRNSFNEKLVKYACVFTLLSCLLFCDSVNARTDDFEAWNDSALEKKVDYLERIYFSGENKEGLNTKVLIALQELQDKSPTPALAKQVTFLLDIKDKASAADNACDILDMLAVGIYNIDPSEAVLQGVRMPSDKAKAKAGDALASLTRLNSTASNLSGSATNLAWSSLLLNGGRSTSFISGAGKVAGTASAIGNVAGTMGAAAQTAGQAKDLANKLGIFKKKDKPCNDITKKNIEIGNHSMLAASSNTDANTATVSAANIPAVNTVTTIINIPKVSSASLRALTDTLKNKPGVQSVDKAFNDALSTITVIHVGSTDALADWVEDKLNNKFKVVDYSNGRINLAARFNK